MTTEFVAGDAVWHRVREVAGQRGRRRAALAYLGADAPDLLSDWGYSDLLVCDASRRALRAGSTNPDALQAFLDRGVEVVSVEGLHAKVVAVGSTAVVGSMNPSRHSAAELVEAAVVVSDPGVAKAVARFIDSAATGGSRGPATVVNDAFVRLARGEYRPPRHAPGTTDRSRRTSRTSARLHVYNWQDVEAIPGSVERIVDAHQDRLTPSAPRGRTFEVSISWDRDRWCKPGEWTVWIEEDDDAEMWACPPAECRGIIPTSKSSRTSVYFWAEPSWLELRPLEDLRGHVLSKSGKRLPEDAASRQLLIIAAVFDYWKMPVPAAFRE